MTIMEAFATWKPVSGGIIGEGAGLKAAAMDTSLLQSCVVEVTPANEHVMV